MKLAVQKWVFNPNLEGLFVRVHGVNSDGRIYDLCGVIEEISEDHLTLYVGATMVTKKHHFHISEFGENGLELDVPSVWVECELPEEADQTLVSLDE